MHAFAFAGAAAAAVPAICSHSCWYMHFGGGAGNGSSTHQNACRGQRDVDRNEAMGPPVGSLVQRLAGRKPDLGVGMLVCQNCCARQQDQERPQVRHSPAGLQCQRPAAKRCKQLSASTVDMMRPNERHSRCDRHGKVSCRRRPRGATAWRHRRIFAPHCTAPFSRQTLHSTLDHKLAHAVTCIHIRIACTHLLTCARFSSGSRQFVALSGAGPAALLYNAIDGAKPRTCCISHRCRFQQ